MKPMVLADITKSASLVPSDGKVVIIIDVWGLPLPTSQYLDHLSAAIPKCAFLALDRPRNGIEVARFLRAGFSGFINYDETLYLLGPAINAIAQGRVWTSPEIMRIYMNLTSNRAVLHRGGMEALTVREHQVMELLRRRYSNKEMANLLKISESTVKFHVSNVLMKLNLCDRRDLTDMETTPGPRLLVARKPAQETTAQLHPLGAKRSTPRSEQIADKRPGKTKIGIVGA